MGAAIRPEMLRTLHTAELFAMIILLVMPPFTMLSLKYDQTVAKYIQKTSYQQSAYQSGVTHQAHERAEHLMCRIWQTDTTQTDTTRRQVQSRCAHDGAARYTARTK